MAYAEVIEKQLKSIFEHQTRRQYSPKAHHELNAKIDSELEKHFLDSKILIDLLKEKEAMFHYEDVKKEAKSFKELMEFIGRISTSPEIITILQQNKIDIANLKQSIQVDIAWVNDIIDVNSRLNARIKKLYKYIKAESGHELIKKEFSIINNWQQGLYEHLEKLEVEIHKRAVVVSKKYPNQKGFIARKAVAYALAVMIGFSAFTATFSAEGVRMGVNEAVASEVQEYKTVDEILAPIQNKVFVNKDTYMQEIAKHERVVVFFYEGNDVEGGSYRLANIYSQLLNAFPNLILICYDMKKENLSGSFYLNTFGFKATPYTKLFVKGNQVFEHKGGPLPDEIEKSKKGWQNNFKHLSAL